MYPKSWTKKPEFGVHIKIFKCFYAVVRSCKTIRLMYQMFDPDEIYGMLKFNNTTPYTTTKGMLHIEKAAGIAPHRRNLMCRSDRC